MGYFINRFCADCGFSWLSGISSAISLFVWFLALLIRLRIVIVCTGSFGSSNFVLIVVVWLFH
jgi:hypothetical protein